MKNKNENLSPKVIWRSEKQKLKNKNGKVKNKTKSLSGPPGLPYYPLIYHEIKSRIMLVSLTFTRNFVYKKYFLGDSDEEETSGNVFIKRTTAV